jgi:hypothetical protein
MIHEAAGPKPAGRCFRKAALRPLSCAAFAILGRAKIFFSAKYRSLRVSWKRSASSLDFLAMGVLQ